MHPALDRRLELARRLESRVGIAVHPALDDRGERRVEVGRVRNLRVAGGVTYLDIGRDLDIEKSMVFVEGTLRLAGRYRLEAKYNCYNYDDYILLDRYYTANVVRFNLGYDIHL